MKDKFLRIISPISLIIVSVLDVSVIFFIVFAINKIREQVSFYSIFFLIMVLFALVIAIFVTKETISHGLIFRKDEVEFTALDDNNIFKYDDIEKIEYEKDTKASFVKNFVDRQSRIIFYMNEDKIVTVDIGITTKKALKNIENEFCTRIK